MSGFDGWPERVVTFLSEVAQNNTREWWAENKGTYESELKAPANLLGDIIAQDLAMALEQPVNFKLFRPHRDVRYSKDKSPYNTHLHVLWSLPEERSEFGYFLGLSPEYLALGAGVMGLAKEPLMKYREALDQGELAAVIENARTQGFDLREADLKRIPSPYEKDHPQAELLKYKSCSLWKAFEATADVSQILPQEFAKLLGFQSSLCSVLG